MEELELTYLVKELPKGVFSSPSIELLDIYVPSTIDHPVLRIRKAGQKYEMTKKEPVDEKDSSRQIETTIPLTKAEYDELSTIQGKRVEKTRFYFADGKVTYEIGVFRGELSGLILADVEFSTVEEKANFMMPSWCLADVTQEKFAAGGMLCGKKYADISAELAKFGY